MSYSNGPRIVTNGLVLCLDAGNSKSYPGSGTVWTDLSGLGNNGILTNGPSFNRGNSGSIVFDGINDSVVTSLNIGTSFTWNIWYKTNIVFSSIFRNLISIRGPSYMLMLLDANNNSMGFWASDTLTSGSSLNMNSISTNVWYFATFVREGNSISNGYKAYMNGIFRGSSNTGIWSSSSPIVLGGREDVAQFLNGHISQVSIYNRSLSPQEILQNYNALKGRYNL